MLYSIFTHAVCVCVGAALYKNKDKLAKKFSDWREARRARKSPPGG